MSLTANRIHAPLLKESLVLSRRLLSSASLLLLAACTSEPTSAADPSGSPAYLDANPDLAVVAAIAGTVTVDGDGQVSAEEPIVTFGASDADRIALLAGSFYINEEQVASLPFWWNHTDLTVSVQSTVNDDPQNVQAIHDAIALWSSVLAARLPGISLTDITSEAPNPKSADIIIHYVPHSGGIVKGGFANCGPQKCLTIVVRSDAPTGYVKKDEMIVEQFDAVRVQRTALHEIGHALGLGHAVPLEQSLDLMGYGWAYSNPDVPPILSDCDLQGIAIAFSWFFNGSTPEPALATRISCGG